MPYRNNEIVFPSYFLTTKDATGAITQDKITAGTFTIEEFKITDKQDPDKKVVPGRIYWLENRKFSFSIGRKNSSDVATWFNTTKGLEKKNTFYSTGYSVKNMNFALIGTLELTIGKTKFTFPSIALAQDSRSISGVSRNYWLLGGKNCKDIGNCRVECPGTDSFGQECTIVFKMDVYNDSVNGVNINKIDWVAAPPPPTPKKLLIIAPDIFFAALQPLKKHKEATGIWTHIVTLSSVYQDFAGNDEAERVKRCIEYYHRQQGIGHVLLVGDSDVFPVRYTKSDREYANAFNTSYDSTDLYYAALYKADGTFDDWDWNKNGLYGELHGQTHTGEINIDKVNLTPTVAVGRAIVTTLAGITRFVKRQIRYESKAYQASWIKKALLMAAHDWPGENACEIIDRIKKNYLKGYSCTMLASTDDKACSYAGTLTAAKVTETFNSGVGLVAYIGHGATNALQIPGGYWFKEEVFNLTNEDCLPIMAAAACGTAQFATLPPYLPYTDIHGVYHTGTDKGEIFTSMPPPPACIQSEYNPTFDLATYLTVSTDAGAIAYLGGNTGMQSYAGALLEYFFQGLPTCYTIGEAWQRMIRQYYENYGLPGSLAETNWFEVAKYHQPWKFMLFGDPSLRIGGQIDALSVCCILETGEHYRDFKQALNTILENQTKTIILLDNIYYNSEIPVVNKTIIFDLNGKKLRINSTGHGISLCKGHIKLTNPANGELNVIGSQYGVYATDRSTAELTNASGEIGGVSADTGSKVTINGNITAFSGATYISLGGLKKTQAQCITPTTKEDYLTYTDGANTVWTNPEAEGNNFLVNLQPYDSTKGLSHHEMHRITCTNLPSARNRIKVGLYLSPQEAIRAAREKELVGDDVVDGCFICCNEVHTM